MNPPSAAPQPLSLLVVEDNPADADLIRELLPVTGPVCFQVESVSRLSEALTRLERKGIDLVLLDLGLPDSQGLPTLHKLRAVVPDVSVIVLTGTDDEEQAVAAVREGAQDYLVKGKIDGSLLARAARYALERQKAIQALAASEVRYRRLFEAAIRDITERKRAEAALRRSEIQFRSVWERSRDGMRLTDGQGVVLMVNQAFCDLVRKTRDEIEGHSLVEIYGADQREHILHRFLERYARRDFIPHLERKLRLWNGQEVWLATSTSLLDPDEPAPMVLNVFHNITERKRAEANQQLALKALRLLNRPNNLPVLVGELMRLIQHAMGFDAVGLRIHQGEDFPYYVQNGFSDAFVKEENFLCAKGKDAAILRAPDGKAVLECTCGLVLSGRTDPSLPCFTKGGSFWSNKSSELLALAPAADPRTNPRNRCIHDRYESFALIPLRSGDAIIGLLQLNDRRRGRFTPELILFFEGLAASVGIALKRRQAQDAMHEREADLELAQQIGQIGSWESDLAAGTLVWSKESYRIFGCDPAAFVPTREGFFQLVHPDDRARVREAVEESIRSGADYELDHRIRWPNGTERVVHEKGHLLRDAQEKAERLVGTTQDITERKNLEMQFLRAQRLEAVGTLAGGIAHDLNNILAPIRMVAPFLREAQTPAEMAENVDIIEASTQRATDVVRQLLTFSRGQSSQRIPLDLKHLLRDLRSVLHETFPKNITFALSEAPDLWPLLADPTQLHQILINLCINARDAMLEGGTMAVTAANFQADDHYAGMVADARPGPYVLLTVSDTGSGIRPEDLDKIFDPFFTTKEVGKGTGLGLATVHRVVTGHGGFVRVRSQVGRGTTFDVYLPASPEAVAPAEPALPTPLPAGHGQLIMVVDDEEPIRQITQKTLVRHGYQVVTANDGTDAIAVFVRHQAEVKGVVTDLMMPGMDALGLVKVLAQMKPGLPVILSTGLGEDPEQNQRFEALGRLGVSIVLTKPYTADELLNALQAVLPRSEPLNP